MEDISKAVEEEAKALIQPLYKDLAQPAAKEIGTVLGRTVHNLLFPVRGLCWGFEKIEQVVNSGLEKRLSKVPDEKLHTPDPEIAVPLIQALTYTAQNDTLREMYLTLLSNSMNSDLDKTVHPSYVDIIKQMNHLDAIVFKTLSASNEQYIKAITPRISLKNQRRHFVNALPQWFLGWTIEMYDIFDISACLVRLSRLGLVELMYERATVENEGYDDIRNSTLLTPIFNRYVSENQGLTLELTATNNVLYVNEFGQQFAKACL